MSKLAIDFGGIPLPWRVLLFLALGGITHLIVLLIERAALRFSHRSTRLRLRKLQSLTTLLSSAAVFVLYFLLIGFVLSELGVSLTAYLASASVVGLAVAFGSQGLVQDVVTGLTLIFSDLIDVGELVDLGGQVGIVRSVTMRFVELENALGGIVYVPNRTISNVINYPLGHVRCYVDVTVVGDATQKARGERAALQALDDLQQQFPGILAGSPTVEERRRLGSGKEILRLVLPVWPNRGGPIETTFREELTAALKHDHPDYQPWMVAISYAIEPPSSGGAPRLLPWLRSAEHSRERAAHRAAARKRS